MAAEPLVTVRLLQLPVALHARTQQHGDELLREFRLLAESVAVDRADGGDPTGASAHDVHLPRRLVELTERLTSRYGHFATEADARLEAAVATGQSTIDLEYRVPPEVGGAARELSALLEEADEFCREGRYLLTLSTPPDLSRYRRWYLAQFVEQAAGADPQPWPRYAE